ncbi:MAG: hypothetical protein SFY92_00760 [Verrucomicrobiae bacterium]|nr:hypothetical protein [Verrucomicrobiae bacterium]
MPTVYRTLGADESKGKFLIFEGNENAFIFIGGVMLAMGCLYQLKTWNLHYAIKFGLAAVPVILASVWIFGFRQGKPPAYDKDYFHDVFNLEKSWKPDLAKSIRHPLAFPDENSDSWEAIS